MPFRGRKGQSANGVLTTTRPLVFGRLVGDGFDRNERTKNGQKLGAGPEIQPGRPRGDATSGWDPEPSELMGRKRTYARARTA